MFYAETPITQVNHIQKIYNLLSIQLIITWILTFTFYMDQQLTIFILNNNTLIITSSILTLPFTSLAYWYGTIYPYNYLTLLGFTLSQSYCIAYVCLLYETNGILAWSITTHIFIIITLYIFIYKQNFDSLQNILYSSLWIIIIGTISQIIIFPHTTILNTSLAVFGAITAGGYILYHTSIIIRNLSTNQSVYECFSLYLHIIMLFIRCLQLFTKHYPPLPHTLASSTQDQI